jgi:hypothetical protein
MRQTDSFPLRRVVHAQVISDPSHHDISGVDSHPYRERHSVPTLHILLVATELFIEVERRVAGALRVVLVGYGCPEECHDPVARVLVYGSFEAVNSLGEDAEEAIHDFVPLLGSQMRRELNRSFHIREEHRDLFPLALECASGREDLLGEVLRGVGARIAFACFDDSLTVERRPALFAEFRTG